MKTPFLPLLATLLALDVVAGDWPRFRGPDQNGISQEKNWLGAWPGGQPKQLWKKNVGTGYSSMSVAEGRLYTMGNAKDTDTLYCFDAQTGEEIWKVSYPQKLDPKYYEGGPSATPTVAGGRVYAISKQGEVRCLEAATGKEVWVRNVRKEHGLVDPEWGFAGSPLVMGDRVFLNAGSHGIALETSKGDTVWVSGTAASGYSSPLPFDFNGQPALAIFAAKALVIVDTKSGKELSRFPWETMYDVNAPDPVIVGRDVFITSGYKFLEGPGTGASGALVRPKAGKAERLWHSREIASQLSTPVLIDGHLYGLSGNGDRPGHLRCLDAKTGEVKWSSPEADMGNLIAADGKLIWVTGKGELVVVKASAAGYQEVARAQVTGGRNWVEPVLANGRLYVRNSKGDVVCVDVKGSGPVL
jgi:outer membrane protein assembly factor BamB